MHFVAGDEEWSAFVRWYAVQDLGRAMRDVRILQFAPVAHKEEQRSSNPQAASSNLAGRSIVE